MTTFKITRRREPGIGETLTISAETRDGKTVFTWADTISGERRGAALEEHGKNVLRRMIESYDRNNPV